MAAKELYSDQEAGNEESTLLLDPYEEEETLSLCDLPIYSAQWDGGGGDHFSKEDAKIFNNNKGDELFEFFSEEFTSSSTRTAENIIFCGKLIPFKAEPTNSLKKEEAKGNNSKSLAFVDHRDGTQGHEKQTEPEIGDDDVSGGGERGEEGEL
ncbi:hypothetical protein RJT34_24742 [Clitoria ternatea]|uniref:Uncharacterized protein n=1 Tax=Clitoria ternatea TaxID=43366 RepID=A0AAN9IJG2_CLITE